MEGFRSMVLEGPDLERNKVVRWRCADLQAESRPAGRSGVAEAHGRQAAAPCILAAAAAPIIRRKTSGPGDL